MWSNIRDAEPCHIGTKSLPLSDRHDSAMATVRLSALAKCWQSHLCVSQADQALLGNITVRLVNNGTSASTSYYLPQTSTTWLLDQKSSAVLAITEVSVTGGLVAGDCQVRDLREASRDPRDSVITLTNTVVQNLHFKVGAFSRRVGMIVSIKVYQGRKLKNQVSVLLVGSLTVLGGKEVLNGSWAERYSRPDTASTVSHRVNERGYMWTDRCIADEGVAALRLFAHTARKRREVLACGWEIVGANPLERSVCEGGEWE
ncbi:hypothetical protein IMY05_C4445001000 [Salix suchowensis]|nr:hypothetical protein IMY05_C4445001000 [Salix suchowensis]